MRTVVLVCTLFAVSAFCGPTVPTEKPLVSKPSLSEPQEDDESRLEVPSEEGTPFKLSFSAASQTGEKPASLDLKMEATGAKQNSSSMPEMPMSGPMPTTATPVMQQMTPGMQKMTPGMPQMTPGMQQMTPGMQQMTPGMQQNMSDTLEAVPSRYTAAVGQLARQNSTDKLQVKGDTRQFGSVPEVLPFTRNLLLSGKEDAVSFEGYKVFRVKVNSKPTERLMNELADNQKLLVSFWNDPRIDNNVTFSASEESAKSIVESFQLQGLKYEILTNNLKNWLDMEKKAIEPSLYLSDPSIENFKMDKYHTFEEISSFIDLIASKYPSLVQVVYLGQTYEQNPIRGLKFSTGASPTKKMIYIDATTHAREWITTATALYMIKDLVSGYESDPQIRGLLEKFDFTIVPVLNVDGYKYTWTSNRMWRKNRVRFNNLWWCVGVDPNRNYDQYWGTEGSSANPCSDVYRGTSAFSEAETQAVRGYLSPIRSNVAAYMSLHSYGNYMLLPYGTGPTAVSRYHKELTDAAKAFNDALYKKAQVIYTAGAPKQILYPASGLSNDWVHDSLGIVHAYVAEISSHEGGFILPPELIVPTVEGFYAGLKAMFEHIGSNDVTRVFG